MEATLDSSADVPSDQPSRVGPLARLWHQRSVVGPVFGVSLFLVIGVLYVLPVSYVSVGSLIVGDRTLGAVTPPGAGDAADVESTVLLVRSQRLLRMVLARPGISDAIEADCAAVARQIMHRLQRLDCARVADDADAELSWLTERLSVARNGQSAVVSVSYRSPSSAAAQSIVDAVMQTFLDDEQAKLRRPHAEAIAWMRQRSSQLDGELQNDTAALEAFRQQHGLVRGMAGPLASERLTQADQRLTEAEAAQTEAEARLRDTVGGLASRQALDSRTIADLRQQLAQANALAAIAAQRFGAQNPLLAPFRRQQAEAAARLAGETSRMTEAARRNLELAKARVTEAARELATRTDLARDAAQAETQLAAMTRDLDVKRGNYVEVSKRLSQMETEQRMLEPRTRLLDAAELPSRPAFPQRTPFLIGGLAFATVLATAAGLLTYKPVQPGALALARTFTRIPILAQVPELRLRRTGKKEVNAGFPFAAALSLLETHPPLLEAIRILHARLTLAGFGTTQRTLMVASEVAGEGKSFITLALARMARAAGRRVLVIETCLRSPFLEDALHVPPSAGLAEYLLGGAPETIQLGAVPGVDFMLAGEQLAESTELLSGSRFVSLLEWAQQYDLVLIDSAPVAELMDTALLAPKVDGVLFCLRAGRAPAVQGLNSLPEMQRANGNVVGLTFTFVPDDQVVVPAVGRTRAVQSQRQFQPDPA